MEIILANPLQLLSKDHMENIFVLMSYPVMATLLLLEHPHKFMVVSGFLVVCFPEVSTKLCMYVVVFTNVCWENFAMRPYDSYSDPVEVNHLFQVSPHSFDMS